MTKEKHGLARGLTNYGDADFSLYLRRSFAKSMGYSTDMLSRRVVGICQAAGGFNNCHRHFPELVDAVKRGVLAAGALPIDFPDHLARRSLPQPDQHDVPQPDGDGRRGNDPRPADGRGRAGRRLRQDRAGAADGRGVGRRAGGAARRRADAADGATTASVSAPAPTAGASGRSIAPRRSPIEEIAAIEGNLATTAGSCAVMGTASTMASIAEALGMTLAGHRGHSRGARRPPARRRGERTPRGGDDRHRSAAEPDHHGASRSRTRCACCWRSAARPMRSIHLTAIAGRVGIDGVARAAQRAVRRNAGPGRPQADRPALHVGSVRRRRHRRGAARAEAAAASRLS